MIWHICHSIKTHDFTCVAPVYDLNILSLSTEFISVDMSSESPVTLTIYSWRYWFTIIILCCVWSICMSLLSTFCMHTYPHYVLATILICTVRIYKYSMHPWSTILPLHSYDDLQEMKVSLCKYHYPLTIYVFMLLGPHSYVDLQEIKVSLCKYHCPLTIYIFKHLGPHSFHCMHQCWWSPINLG